ncbi:hypothetical protein [Nocardia caishijiensis]|uniref:Flavin-binding monooxygenase-like protein n=1 Tax=Nocardia caishijiensis TaxID=184756 RepID=A0ABQ6YS59_9NOCA|nr:hypothetical protein [Nocardia caishijiensis]KAF0848647.1 flavin-binding monooxygenase-like protein [Nocardia caishijiensis]
MNRLPGTFDGRIVHHLDFQPRREFTGERVAIIGSGAAAARLLPGIAAEAARVTVFQTEAVWIVPRAPLPASVLRHAPDHLVHLAARTNLRIQVRDSWLRYRLTPDDEAGVAVHDSYYRTLRRPHCRLVTWPVARLVPLGVRTVDGIEHRVDTIVFADDADHVVRTIGRGDQSDDRVGACPPTRRGR